MDPAVVLPPPAGLGQSQPSPRSHRRTANPVAALWGTASNANRADSLSV
ncbi:hypothetical protein IMZ48_09740 [Candidatus Bathyarchaeota archaeon]|nr:hypothetical protein [Candidatus Bathyarchaeota archaeon]